MKTLLVETVAQAYLELLRDRGIDCFFDNAGTDFASIVDAFARFATERKATPRPMAVPQVVLAPEDPARVARMLRRAAGGAPRALRSVRQEGRQTVLNVICRRQAGSPQG